MTLTLTPGTDENAVAVREDMPVAHPGALLAAIVGLAKDRDFDVAKLDALMKMQERMEDRQAERAFAESLRAAQAEIPQVERMGTVSLGQGKGSYAFSRLEDMDRVLRPIMDKHGFSIRFDRVMRPDGGGLIVTGTLMHVAGHSKEASFPLPLDSGAGRNNLQAAGSTDSYARRYLIEGFFNIVRKSRDDDGVLGGTKFIGPADVSVIIQLIQDTQTDTARFLQHAGVAAIENIEVGQYVALRNMLEAKKAKQAKNGNGGK